MRAPTLIGLGYSPWTERARWALDHHRIVYGYREHVPMLGEPLLRWRTKAPSGALASVPVLVDRAQVIAGSVDIVLHADRVGGGSALASNEASLRTCVSLADRGLAAIRGLVTSKILRDPDALRESASAAVPAAIAGLLAPVAAIGARFVARKYGAPLDDPERLVGIVGEVTRELSVRVGTRMVPEPKSLRAEHVVLATLLQGVRPVDHPAITLGPAVRRAWTLDALTDELAPLLAWRDALYRAARLPPGTATDRARART